MYEVVDARIAGLCGFNQKTGACIQVYGQHGLFFIFAHWLVVIGNVVRE